MPRLLDAADSVAVLGYSCQKLNSTLSSSSVIVSMDEDILEAS